MAEQNGSIEEFADQIIHRQAVSIAATKQKDESLDLTTQNVTIGQ